MANSYEYVKNSRARLKQRLVYIMGDKCCLCGYNKCITALEFHHKNPEEKDFSLASNANIGFEKACEEIKKCILVCANCHREIHAFNLDVSNINCFNEEKAKEKFQELEDLKTHKLTYCKNCGAVISDGASLCVACNTIAKRTVERPDRETLKKLIREKSFLELSRNFGVSDNAIRKWCKSMNLPSKKTEITKFTEEEWKQI